MFLEAERSVNLSLALPTRHATRLGRNLMGPNFPVQKCYGCLVDHLGDALITHLLPNAIFGVLYVATRNNPDETDVECHEYQGQILQTLSSVYDWLVDYRYAVTFSASLMSASSPSKERN